MWILEKMQLEDRTLNFTETEKCKDENQTLDYFIRLD